MKYNMPSISVNICSEILFLKGFFITVTQLCNYHNNCIIMIFLESLFWILFHQSCTHMVVYIWREFFSVSNFKAHYFCYLPFPSRRDFFPLIFLCFPSRSTILNRLVCSYVLPLELAWLCLGLNGGIIKVRKVSAW